MGAGDWTGHGRGGGGREKKQTLFCGRRIFPLAFVQHERPSRNGQQICVASFCEEEYSPRPLTAVFLISPSSSSICVAAGTVDDQRPCSSYLSLYEEAFEAQSSLHNTPAQNVVPPGAIIPNAIIHRRQSRNHLYVLNQPLPLGFHPSHRRLLRDFERPRYCLEWSNRSDWWCSRRMMRTRENSAIFCATRTV